MEKLIIVQENSVTSHNLYGWIYVQVCVHFSFCSLSLSHFGTLSIPCFWVGWEFDLWFYLWWHKFTSVVFVSRPQECFFFFHNLDSFQVINLLFIISSELKNHSFVFGLFIWLMDITSFLLVCSSGFWRRLRD